MRTYYGYLISPVSKDASPFKWQTYINGRFCYADTLAGMKHLISTNLGKG